MKQPEALRLADALDGYEWTAVEDMHIAAAELRRLHEVNQMLLDALNTIADETYDSWTQGAIAHQSARAAIEKAGEA